MYQTPKAQRSAGQIDEQTNTDSGVRHVEHRHQDPKGASIQGPAKDQWPKDTSQQRRPHS